MLLATSISIVCAGATCSGGPTPRDTKQSQTRSDLAKNFLARNELDSAYHEAERALRLDPDNAEAHMVLGLVEFLRGKDNNDLLEVNDCLTGVDAEGFRQEMEGHLEAADKHFADALKVDPEYAEALANRGKVATLLENYDAAIELLERALAIPHRLVNVNLARADLGWARFHAGDAVGAAKELRQALQFNATMCVAKYRLGRVYFAREEWNKALEQFQAVVGDEQCPLQEAHLYLVKTMSQLGMTSNLQEAVAKCSSLAPRSCVAAECQVQLSTAAVDQGTATSQP